MYKWNSDIYLKSGVKLECSYDATEHERQLEMHRRAVNALKENTNGDLSV